MVHLINRFIKKKYFVLLLAIPILFGIFGELYNVFILARQKCMVIDFNYPGAEQGLNPDGSMFDISDLKSDEVLKAAAAGMGDENYDIETLKSRIFISSKISSNTLDNVMLDVQNGKNTIYMPTTFYVYYSQKNKFSKNESTVFMANLASAYEEYFGEKYSEKNDILDYTDATFDFSDKDYSEIYRIFHNKVESMISYVKTHHSENRAFYTDDGARLGTSSKKLENFRDVSLEDFNAFIVQNGVSKDNADYVKRLQYTIESKQLDYKKTQEASDIAKHALEIYDPNIAAVAFVPSMDAQQSYYMSRTKTGIDNLTRTSYDNGMEASKTLDEIVDHENLYKKFSMVKTTPDDNIAQAEQMVASLSSELSELSTEITKIDNEYLGRKTRHYFSISVPDNYSIFNLTLIVKWMIFGFVFATMAIVFIEIYKKKLTKKIRTIKNFFMVIAQVQKAGGEER